MPFPPLIDEEAEIYLDHLTVYKKVPDGRGNTIGWTLATLADGTPLVNVPINYHWTHTFDVPKSEAGMSKAIDRDSSNKITAPVWLNIKAEMRGVVTTRTGLVDPVKLVGAPARPVLIPHTYCLAYPDTMPEPII